MMQLVLWLRRGTLLLRLLRRLLRFLALDAKGGESAYERVSQLGGAREGVYSFEILSMCATSSCIMFTFMHYTCVRYYGYET